jgi:pyridoxamine 5'-phosphate oxidase
MAARSRFAYAVIESMKATHAADPIALLASWLAEAEQREPHNPTAMALATADERGAPSVRMVLMRGLDERGCVFYTNLGSRKAAEIAANPRGALCFYWKSLDRQVRAEGTLEQVSDEEADAYFASRDRQSQIGAWASKQSQPLEGRLDLEKRVARYALKFNIGPVPRPPFWSGYRLRPEHIEFWQQGVFRLHERTVYHRTVEGWTTQSLYP